MSFWHYYLCAKNEEILMNFGKTLMLVFDWLQVRRGQEKKGKEATKLWKKAWRITKGASNVWVVVWAQTTTQTWMAINPGKDQRLSCSLSSNCNSNTNVKQPWRGTSVWVTVWPQTATQTPATLSPGECQRLSCSLRSNCNSNANEGVP